MKSLILIMAILASARVTARPVDFEAIFASTTDRPSITRSVFSEKLLTSNMDSRVNALKQGLALGTVITITEDIPEGWDSEQLANRNDLYEERVPEIKRNRRQHSSDKADREWLFPFPLPQEQMDNTNNPSF